MPLAFEQPRFNVDAIWSAPYDNSTISSVNKLKPIWRFSLLFPFFHFSFLSFIFLFNLFVFQVCQRVVLLNLQGTKVNPKFLFLSERERERERERDRQTERETARETESEKEHRRSPVESRVVRWCWVNFQCRGVTLILDDSRKRAYCACSRCGWGLFGHFFFRLYFLCSFSLFGRRPDID